MKKNFLLTLFIFFPFLTHATLHWSPFLQVPFSSETTSMRLSVNQHSRGLITWHPKHENRILSSVYQFVDKEWAPYQAISTQTSEVKILASYFTDQNRGGILWFDKGSNSLGLSRYLSGVWTTPFFLKLASEVESIESLYDSQGNLAIVWVGWNGLEKMIQGLFYSETLQTWSTPSDLSTVGLTCSHPKIAMNENGAGIVAWEAQLTKQPQGSSQVFVQAVTFNQQHYHWSRPIYFGYDWQDTRLTNPDVAIDSANNMAIIWEKKRNDETENALQYVRFLAKKNQWSYVSEREEEGYKPHFTKSPHRIQIFWSEKEGAHYSLRLAHFDIANNQWSLIHTLGQMDREIGEVKTIADSHGKKNYAWINDQSLQLVHYDKEWMPPIHVDRYLQSEFFDFGNDGLGNVMLGLIHQGKLMYAIGNYLLPPDFFDGRKIEVRYPSRKVNHGYLSWCHAESPNVMGYIIRRNGVVQAVLPSHTLQYTDHRCPFDPVNYELSIVNVDNIESHAVKRDL